MQPRLSRLCLALTLCALAPPALAQSSTRAPSIVYVMADELGYYELSCMGNPNLRTPHIDRLAAEGMRFTQALAGSSLCAPTRACLLTGKHSGHTSVRTNGGGTPLRAEEPTIASVLKGRGYASGGFGKWGCGGRGSTGVPERHGFDVFLGYYDQVHAHSYYPAYLIRNSEEVGLEGNTGGRSGATYAHYAIFEAALEFVRENAEQPFFCYLPVTPPHGLFDIPDEDPAWATFADAPWPEEARRYAAMVSMLDRQVGELLALLDELGIADDTLVVFSGDNGGADYFASKQHPRGVHGANVDPRSGLAFRGRKGNLYEGGLRVPLIARWPGRIAAGSVSDQLCYFPDVLPTLAELAGAPVPQDVDGLSLVPTLLGPEVVGRAQAQHPYLYWELDGQVAVRSGAWKAVRPGRDAGWELYDLDTDLGERDDVSASHPEILARLVEAAAEAHEPAREGTFSSTSMHERDRRAKWGPEGNPSQRTPVVAWKTDGLVPQERYRLVFVSSESTFNLKLAASAFDADPRTHWHSAFQGEPARQPHEVVLDLGSPCRIEGLRYLARQDRGWNGAVAACELYIGDDPEALDADALEMAFTKTKRVQEARFAPVEGRYVRLRVLSEVNGGPWASAAELGVIGTVL